MTDKSEQPKKPAPTKAKAALADEQLDAVVGGSGQGSGQGTRQGSKLRIEIDPTKLEASRVKKP